MAKRKKLPVSIIIAAAILALAFGVGLGAYLFAAPSQKEDTGGQVACTQEAFLCPDGSYVSRTGPSCEFKACPNGEYFEGVLKNDPSGPALIIAAPKGAMDPAYRMPLIFKDASAATPLAGQKIRVYGSFTTGAFLSVDRWEKLSGDNADPRLGNVKVGESVFINGVQVTLNKIVNDSRCPVGAECIWAGNLTVNVSLQSSTDKETLDMKNTDPVAFDSYKISIVNISASQTNDAESYLLTFKVEENK